MCGNNNNNTNTDPNTHRQTQTQTQTQTHRHTDTQTHRHKKRVASFFHTTEQMPFFNSIYRHRFLPTLAEIVPSVVPYASNLYAREPLKLLFALEGGGLEAVEPARGVQQGCYLGPLCYSAGSLKILIEFWAKPPVPGARAVSFIDDITVILPPELSLDMTAIEEVTEWLQERLGVVEGISLNRRKSQALLADEVRPEQQTEEQRVAMDTTGLTVVHQGMRVVGVPVGTEQF